MWDWVLMEELALHSKNIEPQENIVIWLFLHILAYVILCVKNFPNLAKVKVFSHFNSINQTIRQIILIAINRLI